MVAGGDVQPGGTPAPTVMAVRNERGQVGLFVGAPTPDVWLQGGPLIVHTPAVGVDARGCAVAVALGCDGLLHTTRQPEPGKPFGAWAPAVTAEPGS